MYKVILSLVGFTALLFTSCKDRDTAAVEHQIVNDSFLTMIDTLAYRYTSLRPPPPPYDGAYKRTDSIARIPISIHSSFVNIYKWEGDILLALKSIYDSNSAQYSAFSTLLSLNKADTASHKILITKIVNTGKYTLVPNGDRVWKKEKGVIGHVTFSRAINNGTIGIMIVSIEDNLKSGIEKLVLLESSENKWEVMNEVELAVW